MDLTLERKQQIEEEERQRLAEEQYRAQVRANLNTTTNPHNPPPVSRAPEPGKRSSMAGWLLGAIVVGIIGVAVFMNSYSAHLAASDSPATSASPAPVRAPSIRYVPVTQKIASGQIVVRPNGYVQYRFQITPDMRNAQVSGRFNASGGHGNDIEAVIASEEEFTNWINGHQARVFYSTEGRKTTDTFDVRLGPGTYYLAFNNRFSAFTPKDVFLEVDLNSQRTETY
jgi:hypothetical protein